MSASAPNPTAYRNRVWCFFELSITATRNTIFNCDSPAVVEVLLQCGIPLEDVLDGNVFANAFATKSFTKHGDRKTVLKLHEELRALQWLWSIWSGFSSLVWFLVFCFAEGRRSDTSRPPTGNTATEMVWMFLFFTEKHSSSSAGDEHARARTSFARDVNERRHGRDASDTDDCHTRKKGSCAKGDVRHRTATSDLNEV